MLNAIQKRLFNCSNRFKAMEYYNIKPKRLFGSNNNIPVLIGSKVMEYYNCHNIKPNDIDLIITKDMESKFKTNYDKYDLNIINNNNFDIQKIDHNSNIFEQMFLLVNKNYKKNDSDIKINLVKSPNDIDILVPPLEFMYALKKGHIHRILRISPDVEKNIKIWKRSMEMFHSIQLKLGKDRMNKIIYGDDLYSKPIRNKKDNETLLDFYTRMIYIFNFEQTNKRTTDTKFNIEIPNSEYFKDNVTRYIEHDALHNNFEKGNTIPLFKKFKLNESDGCMNKYLFLKANDDEKLQTLKNEISVLFIERYLLPIYKNNNDKFNLNNNEIINNFNEIVSHFVTNLCGTGYQWLRMYALDNYHFIGNINNYNIEEMINFC